MTLVLTRQPPRVPMHRQTTGLLRYRADIDGLRAVAILPVVLYHAGIPGFSGGFVGVDVFFVISGFLMASLISGEIAQGDFSLLHFYERRIRRILPALFVMIAASAVMAWIFFMPVEFEYFAHSMKAAALFTSNIQFEKESGYFDIGAQTKPLLHTWSLAVEEQFYIAFPLVLMVINRFDRRWTVPVLFTLLAVSFLASIWTVLRTPTAAFYLSQFRAWELLLGALLALDIVPTPSRHFARQALAALGIAMIALAIFTYSDHTLFPGLAALLPCAGAALIIHSDAGDGAVGRVLQAPPLVFVGLISYSLYLWHWPIIVFTRYLGGGELSPMQGSLIVAGSIVLAILSWRFIEQPFRGHARWMGQRPLFAGAALTMIAAIGFGGYVINTGGMPNRLPEAVRAVYAATYDVSRFNTPDCFIEDDASRPSLSDVRMGRLCKLGVQDSDNPAFLVWGDSHAGAMAPAIDGAAAKAGISGLVAGHSSCPPLPGVQLSSPNETRRCGAFNAAVRDLIAQRHVPLVFLVAYWPKYVHDAELPNEGVYFDPSLPPPLADKSAPIVEALDRTMADLTRQGTKVVLVMDVPEMGHYVPEALAKAIMTGTSPDIAPPWDYITKRQMLSRAILTASATKYRATIVDPMPAFCSNEHCDAARDGLPLYKDADHITMTTARSLSYLYAPLLRSLVGQPPGQATAVLMSGQQRQR